MGWVGSEVFERKRDRFVLVVEVEDKKVEVVMERKKLGRMG